MLKPCINCGKPFETESTEPYVLCPTCIEMYPGENGEPDKLLTEFNKAVKMMGDLWKKD